MDSSTPNGMYPAKGVLAQGPEILSSQISDTQQSRSFVASDDGLERKPSVSYGHHRQASIVGGGLQHSRNASFVNSPVTSPLSPQAIAAAAGGSGSISDSGTEGGQTIRAGEATKYNASAAAGQRRLERMHSGRVRRDPSHLRSLSRPSPHPEPKSVGEYALHHLLNAFVYQAEQKFQICCQRPWETEPHIDRVCGPGVDPQFDQLISALGHISRQKPKPLIDFLMMWRKDKSQAANVARAELQGKGSVLEGTLSRRNTDSENPSTISLEPAISPQNHSRAAQGSLIQLERRSSVSIYLLCRVLIEVIRQTTLASLTPDMLEKLEEIIFEQLKVFTLEQLDKSPLRMSNFLIYRHLLGVMSSVDFSGVSSRFIRDLDRVQKEYNNKGALSRDAEEQMELLIMGMYDLPLSVNPEDRWDKSCNFMISLAKLFADSHGQRIKQAYCQLITRLLLPLVEKSSSHLAAPKWRSFLETANQRLLQMLLKPKHWQYTFPLSVSVICTYPLETFANQWMQAVLGLQPKLKDRMTRAPALQGICRLVWTYLARTSDQAHTRVKKLEEVTKLVFPPGKRTYLSTEAAVAEPVIQLIRFIGIRHQEFAFRTIIFPLINSDLFSTGKDLKVEQLEPEKMVIGIRAFLAIMSDLEKATQDFPPFPQSFDARPVGDVLSPPAPPLSGFDTSANSPTATHIKEERLSRPVITTGFSESVKGYYERFCEILGKITIICDNTFGGQAALDEKFSAQTPKTPISETFSFSRRDDSQAVNDQKQGFYDLLHVAVQALPRCLSAHIPFNPLINLLCTGTAHVQSNIAFSSAQSLKSIARQSHAQQVTIGFARFIFNFDDRYSTMSEGGMLGPGHIESTLRLYVELLRIWIEEIGQKTKDIGGEQLEENRGVHLDFSGIWAYVDEVESHGLFFLCSQSRAVRSFAVTVLRLITQFDKALGKDTTRFIQVMEGDTIQLLGVNDEHLSVAERSRLHRGMRRNNSQTTLIELCSSEISYEMTLWTKIFPNLIHIGFDQCPFSMTLTRDIICARLVQMHRSTQALADVSRGPQYAPLDLLSNRSALKYVSTQPESLVEQWKLYLIFACTTMLNAGSQKSTQLQSQSHMRKTSKVQPPSQDKITSARPLFSLITPLLSSSSSSIRDAVVMALGSININLYRILLECLEPLVAECNEDARRRIGTHQRTGSSPRRNRSTDRLRTELTHIYKLTSHFLQKEEAFTDEWILNNLVGYTKDLRIFLSDAEVQNDFEFQRLRCHYCGLMEELFEGINRTKDPSRWMPFESRKSAFALMEDWCGYSPNQSQIREREDTMRRSVLDQRRDLADKGTVTAAMEIEKRNLKTAALSAMAALCGGPVSITTESSRNLQFDVGRMLSWIDTIFQTISDRMHTIGRRALKNLIVHNKGYPLLLERSIEMCYLADTPRALGSYFEVVSQVLSAHEDYPLHFWRALAACLFTLGNENSEIRSKSARLLRTLEGRQQKTSKIQDFDVSVSDKTKAVYKLAQFEISRRCSKQHSELAFLVFSEFALYFKNLQPDHQRNMVEAILPWIQTIELQLDPNGGPTASSYMVLANLFEITIKSSGTLHNEVQALWQALATGPHGGNVQVVLDFIISLCLDKREQNFVDFAKQIVVFLSSTPAGLKVVEFLLLQINPKTMVQEKRNPVAPPPETFGLPYVADLTLALPIGNRQTGFSLGQLALILLVDLMVSPIELPPDTIPLLLQAVLIFWDHYIPLVQDQAREMLIHLIHELMISKIDDGSASVAKRSAEDFIESVRRHEKSVLWGYEDNNGKDAQDGVRVPEAMEYVASAIVQTFSITYPGIREQLAKTTLTWATTCAVRHLACRSFQIFRCILTSLDQNMLADMLGRLSNTIADEDGDIQTFSMEILTTLKTIIAELGPSDVLQFPQLFWTTCACLNTVHEKEFLEALSMLENLLDKIDLSNPTTVRLLSDSKPPKWEGSFEGVQDLVYKGLRSDISLGRTLNIISRLSLMPNNELVGDKRRLLFSVLANLPRYLYSLDTGVKEESLTESAKILADAADLQQWPEMSRVLSDFLEGHLTLATDLVAEAVMAIRSFIFPDKCLVFLMGLLTNRLSWFKVKTMQILCVLVPDIDMRKPEFASHGPDIISPLLRLLQTEFCPQALQVLDNVMIMSGTPMDKDHIRMSIASSQSRAIKKEYERTKSLFGIPEETGWSIPEPATHSATTRNNVHAVFYTCGNADPRVSETTGTPDVEFHLDDYQYDYFGSRTATMMSEEGRGESNMGELVMKLDSLGDLFEDTTYNSEDTIRGHGSVPVHFATDPADAGASVYDQQTLPMLQKSLARTGSISSFKSGFEDHRTPFRENGSMSPMAFAGGSIVPRRPTMHSRSVTSPAAANGYHSSTGAEVLSDEETDGVFSDDNTRSDTSTFGDRLGRFDGLSSTSRGNRFGMRRIPSISSRGNRDPRLATRLPGSPEVPKIPSNYLPAD